MKYLLPKEGKFYKANLHCHTNLSDGTKTPEEVKEIYKSLGYSVVAYTDHDIMVPHPELCDDEFVALNGFEVEINQEIGLDFNISKCCHICFVALSPDNIVQPMWHREKYLRLGGDSYKYAHMVTFDENEPDYEREYSADGINDMIRIGREKGFFVTYNHPVWNNEGYTDYINYSGMHAMEMFNGSCLVSGYEDYNPTVYDAMLRSGKKLYCIGADDNHNGAPQGSPYFDSGISYIQIKADKLDYTTIAKAIEDGNFYSSEGPEIYELTYNEGKVHIKCSDAKLIALYSNVRQSQAVRPEIGGTVCEAEFTINKNSKYFRLTVTDAEGKHACTNAYFIEDLI